ncbi:MAG: hypothetical protein PHT19_03790 [Methylococcus sp.]|nr:hypothetical protein [Methylococcus sp.]
MNDSKSPLVHIIQKAENKGATRAHTQFRTLVGKIDRQKRLLAEWNETLPQYHQKIAVDYDPLWNKLNAHRIELAHFLDRVREQAKFKQHELNKLDHLIRSITRELIADHGHTELKPLYDKYAEVGFDTEMQAREAASAEAMRSMMSPDFFGEDEIPGTPEELSRTFEEKIRLAQKAAEEKQRQAEARRAQRPKTARQQEKEAHRQTEAKHMGKSIQEIYRKLVTAMHPDREPDPAERERKTELMQQANVAYKSKDLLQLLELQLALEQIDSAHIGTLADDQLKYYNKVLRQQSGQLQQELEDFEYSLKRQLGLPPFAALSPKQLVEILNADIRRIQRSIDDLREDLEVLRDVNALKAWLKTYKISKQDREDSVFF